MKDLLLIPLLLALILLGGYWMKCLDQYLEENEQQKKEENAGDR